MGGKLTNTNVVCANESEHNPQHSVPMTLVGCMPENCQFSGLQKGVLGEYVITITSTYVRSQRSVVFGMLPARVIRDAC